MIEWMFFSNIIVNVMHGIYGIRYGTCLNIEKRYTSQTYVYIV